MSLDVDEILTHEELDAWLGGKLSSGVERLLPDTWNGSSVTARQSALDDILITLRGRTPPILDFDLANPAELAPLIRYGAAEHIYRAAITSGRSEELFVHLAEHYGDRFRESLSHFAPTLADGGRGAAASIAVHRR